MKKVFLLIFFSGLLFLMTTNPGLAGLCIDESGTCNDVFLTLDEIEGVYGLHGYEYGCGHNDRLYDGSLKIAGDNVYYGVVGALGQSAGGDYGMYGYKNGVFSLSNFSGSCYWQYMYLSSGSAAGHGGTADISASLCGPQSPEQSGGLDTAGE